MSRKIYTILSLLMVAAFVLSACGAPATEAPQTEPAAPAATEPPAAATEAPAATEPPAAEQVTVTWWHITTDEGQAAVWQSLADSYMAEHPNVNVEITILENEAFKTKMTTVVQSGDMPDIFQSWGGGVMNEYIAAGMMKDITADLDADGGAWRDTFSPGALGVYSLDGKNYGVPWDMGMVGFWYNKDLFSQAGIEAPPGTWDELLDAVTKLKAAGITPIALGEGDKWPGHFWFGYLATRICGQNGFQAAASRSGSFADECFVEAGNKLLELNALEPFQDGYLGAVYGDQSTIMGNGQAAMELMGQWAPGAQAGNSADGQGLGDKLGFFPFPAVDGGAGAATDAFGGGNGFGIGKDAEPEAVDFVKWLTSADAQVACAEAGFCIPVVKGGEAGMSDPLLIELQETLSQAEYFQLYYDQALPPAVGSVVNDSIQGVLAGTLTPEEAAQAIEDSAAQELQ
jgi:raffinose/stachyose/melibiose transport system substrate-binding protein